MRISLTNERAQIFIMVATKVLGAQDFENKNSNFMGTKKIIKRFSIIGKKKISMMN